MNIGTVVIMSGIEGTAICIKLKKAISLPDILLGGREKLIILRR